VTVADDVDPLDSAPNEIEEMFPSETLHLTTLRSTSITKFTKTGDLADLPRDVGTMYLALRRAYLDTLGETTAEEVAYEALLKACRDYRPGAASVKTWARTKIEYALKNAVRKKSIDERLLDRLGAGIESARTDEVDEVWAERAETAQPALNKLDEIEFRIMIAPHEGVGDKQLASQLGTTPSALSTHRYRIMQHLRRVIAG
jgi:RNA polymerase sigma factor (sigma-70 family)